MKRLSIASVKGMLSRKSSNASQESTGSADTARGRPRASPTDPAPVPESNPFAPRFGPTRRPKQRAPPPPYSEAIRAPAAVSASPPAAAAAPAPARDVSPSPSAASAITVASVTTADDPYAFLKTFDTIFLIDDSGSMAGRSWREVQAVLANIAPICTAHDSDGIDVFFLNHKSREVGDAATGKAAGGYNVRDDEQVEDLFRRVRPTAATPTGTRINAILKPYLRHYEARVRACGGDPDDTGVKPVNMIVITDGVPTDDLEGVLVSVAQKLDRLEAPPYQVGVQFFQVGSELSAAEHLRELDDNLGGGVRGGLRDMIDTVSWNTTDGARPALTADAILKTVLGAVVKRLDRRGVEAIENNSSFLSPNSRR